MTQSKSVQHETALPLARYIAIDTFSIASARRQIRCRENVSMHAVLYPFPGSWVHHVFCFSLISLAFTCFSLLFLAFLSFPVLFFAFPCFSLLLIDLLCFSLFLLLFVDFPNTGDLQERVRTGEVSAPENIQHSQRDHRSILTRPFRAGTVAGIFDSIGIPSKSSA